MELFRHECTDSDEPTPPRGDSDLKMFLRSIEITAEGTLISPLRKIILRQSLKDVLEQNVLDKLIVIIVRELFDGVEQANIEVHRSGE